MFYQNGCKCTGIHQYQCSPLFIKLLPMPYRKFFALSLLPYKPCMSVKNLIIPFLALLFCNGSPLFAQKKQYQVTAIAFYNLENLYDTEDDPRTRDEEFTPTGPYNYTEEVYHQKLHNLATVLAKLGTEVTPDGPAIIGHAEVENAKVLEDLAAQPEIADRHYRFVQFNSPDYRGIDVALMYNPKYFSVLKAEALYTDISATGEKGGKTRDVLYVTGLLNGDTTHVFVNHWPSRRGGEAASAPLRAIAAGVSRKVIDSLMKVNPASRVVVMGDLNDDPDNASITKVLGAKSNREKVGQSDLYNPFTSFFNQGIGTLGYNDAWDLFDQIIISGSYLKASDTQWRYYKAEVFNRDFLISKFGQYKGYPHRSFSGNTWINGYSDHFPTLVYLIKPL